MTGARTGSRVPRIATPGFWPAFRKTQPARQRRPHPTVVPSTPHGRRFAARFLAAFGGSGPEGPRTQRTVVAVLWFSTAVGRSVGSASARSKIVPVAVKNIARPTPYRWVRGPAIRAPDDGRTDWFTGGADRATRVLARFRKTQPARQRRPHPAVVPSTPHGRRFAARFLAAFGGSGPEGPRTQRTVVAVLWFSTAVGRSVGSASARREIVPVAVENVARPTPYRWVRGPAIRAPDDGRTDWFTGVADRDTRVLARFPEDTAGASAPSTPHGRTVAPRVFLAAFGGSGPEGPRTQRTVVAVLWFSTAVWQVGGERIGPQRDRVGGSKEHRQAGGVSLGARAFWPAFRKTQPARQRRPHPTVVPSTQRSPLHGAVFWPPSAAAGRKARAPSARSLPCCGSLQQLAGRWGAHRPAARSCRWQ